MPLDVFQVHGSWRNWNARRCRDRLRQALMIESVCFRGSRGIDQNPPPPCGVFTFIPEDIFALEPMRLHARIAYRLDKSSVMHLLRPRVSLPIIDGIRHGGPSRCHGRQDFLHDPAPTAQPLPPGCPLPFSPWKGGAQAQTCPAGCRTCRGSAGGRLPPPRFWMPTPSRSRVCRDRCALPMQEQVHERG